MTTNLAKRREAGFTVVELMAAMGVLVLVVGAVLALLVTGFRTERGQEARTRALDELRTAMNRVTKEVRQATSVTTTSTASSLDMQTLINGVERRVVYDVSGQTLRRAVDGGTAVPVALALTTSSLFCYDAPACVQTGPSSTTPSIIRVTISLAPGQSGAKAVSMSQDIRLRNTRS